MACRLDGASHYLKQYWIIVNWALGNKLQWNFNRNSKFFVQENSLEHVVCEMASILSRPQWVKTRRGRIFIFLTLTIAPTCYKKWCEVFSMGHLPGTQNCGLHMCRECRESFPRHRLQRKPLVNDPGMHHGTCVTQVPWCISGSLFRGGGVNIPGIPGACATRIFTYLARSPWEKFEYWIILIQSLPKYLNLFIYVSRPRRVITQCGLMASYGDMDLGQHWFS